MNIGHVIKTLRTQRGLTQEQIALEADIATSNISRIEKGQRQPSQKVLQKIAQALDTKPSVLYTASEQPISQISVFLQQEGMLKKEKIEVDSLLLKQDSQTMLALFNELTPSNKSLLLEQLKTLHSWQNKPSS
ncbi:MAG: helix-turn-helix domain-containing protein [Marinomonas foliarum]|jgi:transcriptional regulator with XRE-family HTH domain